MKLHAKNYWVVLILLFFLLEGCDFTIQTDEMQTPEYDSGITLSTIPSATYNIAETADVLMVTVEPSITPTLIPYLNEKCVLPTKVDNYGISDIFFLRDLSNETLILTKSDGTRLKTFTNADLPPVSSPDRTKVAFIQKSPRAIVIISANGGEIIKSYPIPENWVWPISWVSENHIFFEKRMDYPSSRLEPGKLIVFNLETSKYEELFPDFPNINEFVEGTPWIGNMIFLPEPNLIHTVYLSGADVVLWNVPKQIEVMRVHGKYTAENSPVWNRKGDWFIISALLNFSEDGILYTNFEDELPYVGGGDDLFLITTQGEINRLTYFSTQYKAKQRGWSLSPDETKLAFWVDTDYQRLDSDWLLAILNISTGEMSYICFSPGNTSNPLAPIWSPDGEALMLLKGDDEVYKDGEVFILDLMKNEIFSLSDTTYGMGWLTPN